MSSIKQQVNIRYDSKLEAYKYQVEVFNFLRDLPYSAILLEQGLGKTKIAIDLLLYWLVKKDVDTVMIVTKKQLVKNWTEELKNHCYIRPKVLDSDGKKNYFVFNGVSKIVITNFETIVKEKNRVELFLKSRNVAIIIDESTKIKNPYSVISQTFFELSPLFKIKTIMTGTIVANRPYDIWAQIFFLDQGKSLGTNFEEFKSASDLRNDFYKSCEKKGDFEQFVSTIYPKIKEFSVRETKQSCGIVLPEKVFEARYVNAEYEQVVMYNQILRNLKLELIKDGKVVVEDESVSIKRLLRLLQVVSNPRLINGNYRGVSGKERELNNLISEIVEVNEKCIVWTNFVDNVEYFCKKFHMYDPAKIYGTMSIEERNNNVDKFKKSEECKILFATPQSAKEGLTLTIANHVIFYDRSFNLDDYLQAQDRIHRISQGKTCYVHNIMVRNSIDEWVDKLIVAKQYAANLAQGDVNLSDYVKIADYSYGEMIKDILNAEELK